MHRFHLPPEACAGDLLRLEGREAHHALRVLRLQRGDEVTVLDGMGGRILCRVDHVTRDVAALRVTRRDMVPAPPCSITLLLAIPKGKIIDGIIARAVELGARRIVPLLTEHVVTRLDNAEAVEKQEKWQQAAVEATKQCGAAWLPRVDKPTTLAQAAASDPFDLALVGSLQTERRHPREYLAEFESQHHRRPGTVAVWIGPEGDFTIEELKLIIATGAKPITLGDLTLRVETAAIYCLSLLHYELTAP
jgi:16S rRNA (uracil1498-N3)-methyltransferase